MSGCRELKLDQFSEKHNIILTKEAKTELLEILSEEFTEGMHYQELTGGCVHLNDENLKKLNILRNMAILDLDIDLICNDAVKEQLDKAGKILSDWRDHFSCRSRS